MVLLFAIFAFCISYTKKPINLEYMAEDKLFQDAGTVPEDIKIIAIDEKTLDKLGPYNSWDRVYFAELIDILNVSEEERPKVIGIDLIMSGTDYSESDDMLVESAGKYGNVVLASKLDTAYGEELYEGEYYVYSYISSETTAFFELDEVTTSAFTTPIFDSDGYIRRGYGVLESEGKVYTSFSMTIAKMCGYAGDEETFEFQYTGYPGDFEVIAMSSVLDGMVPASYFDDCVVLVGAYEEGMMDSYSVPIDHSNKMYGVEIQANQINALRNGKLIYKVNPILQSVLNAFFVFILGLVVSLCRLRSAIVVTLGSLFLYPLVCKGVFEAFSYKLNIIYFPISMVLMFFTAMIIRYVRLYKERAEEMQKMLFSMADSMAVAIEGRTPYNANHTRNVAKRSVSMVDYINKLHREGKTKLHFSENDKNQLYLAAMLHDIGKMDIPTEVMDKPTRLGSKIKGLRDRLCIISLNIKLDMMNDRSDKAEASQELCDIERFLACLDGFDSGRPLKDEEIAFIDDFGNRIYRGKEGDEIPYLTQAEFEDLHIKFGTLSDRERELMKKHVVFTDNILSQVYFGKEFDKVNRIAADHHELLNGSGYPNNKKSEELDALTRIITVMDIFDSLVADDRPYKKAKPVSVAFEILEEDVAAGKLDKEIVEIAKQLYFTECSQ